MQRNLLLTLHLCGMAAWLGANFVQFAVMPRMLGQADDTAARWAEATGVLVQRYYNVAGTVLGITGVLLVLDGDWDWSGGFVAVGIVTLVVGAVLGIVEFLPLSRRQVAAARAGDSVTLRRLARHTAMAALVDTSLVLLTVLSMVARWRA